MSCTRLFSFTWRAVLLAVATSWAASANAGDAFYDIPIREVKLVEGKLPANTNNAVRWNRYSQAWAMEPYIVLDGEGEAYVGQNEGWPVPFAVTRFDDSRVPNGLARVFIRAPEGKDLTGRLYVPNGDVTGMVPLRFTVAASTAKPEAKSQFYKMKAAHYRRLFNDDIPGTAWFRHQVRSANAELKISPEELREAAVNTRRFDRDDMTRTYDLFTGGRALAENLQLDRELPTSPRPDETPVKIDTITGITINEIDWKPLIKGREPKLDVLASAIPADQPVVFFPSFQAAAAVADETNKYDTPVLRLAQPRAENLGIVDRYQRQLGLTMSTLARLLGPSVVKSVALTGSDPYYAMGTDLAVLFESPQPEVLEKLLLARILLGVGQNKDVKPADGEINGLKYRGFRSPDRTVSSYVAKLDNAVIVTNSPYQLTRLAAVRKGDAKPIASLSEYVYFRIQYPLGDPAETALMFLSDPTIRRWCGPRWRIADSHRTWAAAAMAELQASQLDAIVRKTVKPGPIHTDKPIAGAGELTLTPSGVQSANYGTLDFMTPIGEIELNEVTKAEAEAYGRWRDGYQRNWSWGFDPVALRISLGKDKLAADMTVMPLILGSEYRELVSLSSGAQFGPTAGDPHETLAQGVLAINRKSSGIRSAENFIASMGQTISLGWLGQWISVYVEDDPFWSDLAQVKEKDFDKFMADNTGRLPVAVVIDAANPLKLAMFLTGARAFIEQTAPGMTHWESMKYQDVPYVRITANRNGGVPRDFENLAIHYVTLDNSLMITLSEKVLQRAIDRSLARKKNATEGKAVAQNVKPWLGSNVALRVDRKILEIGNALWRSGYELAMQEKCWNNLPILNEWKRMYPDRDPVEVHKEVWGVELLCPGGGKYVWNDKYQTMESTVYGHPGEPKKGPPAPPVLSGFATGEFGLTFENQGVRARAELDRPAADQEKASASE